MRDISICLHSVYNLYIFILSLKWNSWKGSGKIWGITWCGASGSAAHTLPRWKCYSQLQFLHEKVTGKSRESNDPPPPQASSYSNPFSSPSIHDSPDPEAFIISPVAEQKQQPKTHSPGLRRQRATDISNFDMQFASLMKNVTETTWAC